MKRSINLELLRDKLSVAQGKKYWRSLEELADDPAFQELLHREFPDRASEWTNPVTRRHFLGIMGASLALAGVSGCASKPPAEKIMPYVRQPENLVLGKPLYYATAMPLAGYGQGLLVESHEGRPTKVEGNPSHPDSLGATTIQAQASVLGLYEPDRAQTVTFRGLVRTWPAVVEVLRRRLERKPDRGGPRPGQVAIILQTVSSPTLAAQINDFRKQYPDVKWILHEPTALTGAEEGARLAFGKPAEVNYKVKEADVIVALDADFLCDGPGHLRYTREFASRRREGGKAPDNAVKAESKENPRGLNRLYSIETTHSLTGGRADHRLALRPAEVELFTRALAARLGVAGVTAPEVSPEVTRWVEAIAKDLTARGKGKTLVVAGEGQPAAVHALAHAMNSALGNLGQTVVLLDPVRPAFTPNWTLAELVADLKKPRSPEDKKTDPGVDTLIILSANPAYTAPGDLPVAEVLTNKLLDPNWLAIQLSSHHDETTPLCHWHIPESHYLESWSDAVAFDGTASIVQPLIAPLYDTNSAHDVFAALTRKQAAEGSKTLPEYDERTAYELVRDYWRDRKLAGNEGFETYWQKALHDGVLAGSTPKPISPSVQGDLVKKLPPAPKADPKKIDLVFGPDPALFDGRFATNGWLQELPRPLTKVVWDNAAYLGVQTARELGVGNRIGAWKGGERGDTVAGVIRIKVGEREVEAPVFILAGHAEGAITLHLGNGRTRAGKVGTGVGFSAYLVRPSTAPATVTADSVTKVDKDYHLGCTQGHQNMAGRDVVRSASVDYYAEHPNFAKGPHAGAVHEENHHSEQIDPEREKVRKRYALPALLDPTGGQTSLFKDRDGRDDHPYDGHRWGMAIDLGACSGCSACVVACQSENNIPVVGKEEVQRGRHMHWLRIDRYFETPAEQHGREHHKEGEKHASPEVSDQLSVHFQPLPCQHCEAAPCELVCPVEATAHGEGGINDMIYNRCVGTRYCQNNCPYKVRRFNFLQYADFDTPSLKLQHNPDVTVRTRGVMEKCTFCIQRISYARIEANKELVAEKERLPQGEWKRFDPERPGVAVIHDGEMVTACQAACPAEAIIFGDLNDPKSRVLKLHESNLAYGLLDELGTRPRVAYLASVRNPNPELEKK